jgi:hypothetical protein
VVNPVGKEISGVSPVSGAIQLACDTPGWAEMQADEHGSGSDDNGDRSDDGDGGGDHRDGQGDNEQMCTAAALISGTGVQEAELSGMGPGAIWAKGRGSARALDLSSRRVTFCRGPTPA